MGLFHVVLPAEVLMVSTMVRDACTKRAMTPKQPLHGGILMKRNPAKKQPYVQEPPKSGFRALDLQAGIWGDMSFRNSANLSVEPMVSSCSAPWTHRPIRQSFGVSGLAGVADLRVSPMS